MTSPWQKPFRGMQLNKAHPLARGLVGCWVMNEATGDKIFDISGNDHDGTIVNSSTYSWLNNGLDSAGSAADKVTVPDFLSGLSGATLVSDVRFDEEGNYGSADITLFSHEGVSSSWQFTVQSDTGFGFSTRIDGSGTRDSLLFTDYLTPGERAVWAWVWDAQEDWKRIYKNSVQVAVDLAPAHGAGIIATSIIDQIGRTEDANSGFDGFINYIYIYNRALSVDEITWLNREPYAMFEQPISPGLLYYEAVGDTATNLLHGKIIIKDSSIILVDGLVKVQDSITDLFDGEIKVIEKVTSLADGKLQVQDVATSQADGKLQVKDSVTSLADGTVQIQDIDTDLADGKIKVQDAATGLADGLVQVKDSITNLADGKVIVTTVGADTGLADGKIQIKDVTTGIVDGLIKVKDSVTGLADGKVKISNIGSNLADGLIQIKDTVTGIADGKVRIKDIATGTADGLLKIIKSITSNVDGKLKIKDSVKNLVDGKISITGVAAAVIRRISIRNKKPTYRIKIKNVLTTDHILSPKLDLYPSDTLYPSTVTNITIRIS